MSELQHYNLLPDFSLRQAALLAAGQDPERATSSAASVVIHTRLVRAFYDACHEVRALNAREAPWPSDALRPTLLDPSHPDTPPMKLTASYVETVEARFRSEPESVRFARQEVARWFRVAGNGFVPVYRFDFDAPSGRLPRSDVRMPDRERVTLLNIIAALLDLVLSPRAGRDSQADVIVELVENYGEKQGIAKSTLEQKFSEANKSLKGQ
jgi:hypothetical protein